jgi:hypothetical protein
MRLDALHGDPLSLEEFRATQERLHREYELRFKRS